MKLELTKEFLQSHKVLYVNITSGEYSPYYIIEFEDGRKIIENAIKYDQEQTINRVKNTILKNSAIAQRKKKINEIIKNRHN